MIISSLLFFLKVSVGSLKRAQCKVKLYILYIYISDFKIKYNENCSPKRAQCVGKSFFFLLVCFRVVRPTNTKKVVLFSFKRHIFIQTSCYKE